MPQRYRKIPFSVKQKKLQLQAKKRKKLEFSNGPNDEECVQKQDLQPLIFNKKSNPNKYSQQFYRESKEELQQRIESSRQTIIFKNIEDEELDCNNYFIPELDFPKRPQWNFEMTKEELLTNENCYFMDYISSLKQHFQWNELSYFELNLETWRQLWRVLEMSDIILFIVDIRFPALMFPPSLYNYVVEHLGKDMILLLNKIDLVPPDLVLAWKYYFLSKFPSLNILTFTTLSSYNLVDPTEEKLVVKTKKRRGLMRMSVEGAEKLFEICQQLAKDKVDLSSWIYKINEEKVTKDSNEEIQEIGETFHVTSLDTSYHKHEKYRDGILTIGCIGLPNAGKSSVINSLKGKKVVSVSRTPGHTKHFQTIFITSTVKLCDCPGLVFPSKIPKVLQVLMGSFPIAQLREPYTTIKYLAERIDLVKLLHIKHPQDSDKWTAIDICDGWAKLKGFYTARASRLDTYRAANHLLRLALDGKICLCMKPLGYSMKKEYWKHHPEITEILKIQDKDKCFQSPKNNKDFLAWFSDEHSESVDEFCEDDDNNSNYKSTDEISPFSKFQFSSKFSALNDIE